MKIVIVGGGKVGEELCKSLSEDEENDIYLIEKDPRRFEQLVSLTDISGCIGNGVLYETQMEAQVDECDIFIAVTPNDESNIIAAIIAKKIGAKHTLVRVRDPEFFSQIDFVKDNLGINMLISPEFVAAAEIAEIIEFPSALGIERFENGRISIVEVRISEGSSLAGKTVGKLRKEYPDLIFCVINSGGEVSIPGQDTLLQIGDHVHITGSNKDVDRFYVEARCYIKRLHSVLIVGGGRITKYLLQRLSAMRLNLKVIENDPEMADSIASEFPEAVVVYGDGTDQFFLEEEGLSNYDALIALTGVDEENILLSIFASQQGIKKTICKINRLELLNVLKQEDIDSIISPSRLIADRIIRFVRSRKGAADSNVDALYRLENNKVEALQFHIRNAGKAAGVRLKDLELVDNLFIAYIFRDGKAIFPTGEDMIKDNDRMIVVTTRHNIRDFKDILV
ncbi:MAG: Trk system potassium transporter TrkA [Acutalibacteraceae bacterium]|jgi:trk system potassium uptake protein TrkA